MPKEFIFFFQKKEKYLNINLTTITEYDSKPKCPVAFSHEQPINTLGEVLAKNCKTQLVMISGGTSGIASLTMRHVKGIIAARVGKWFNGACVREVVCPRKSQSPDLPLPHGLAPSETMVSDHGLSTENPRNKGASGPGAPIFGFGLADPATKG